MVVAIQQTPWNVMGVESIRAQDEKPGLNVAEVVLDFTVSADTRLEHKPDEELMVLISLGRADALEALYGRHVRGCFGLAMKIVRDPYVAEEVVQDVFVKLWRVPASFVPERGKFSGWLLTLVHNRSVDKLRRANSGLAGLTTTLDAENASGVTLADVLPDASPPLDEVASMRERGEVVRHALHSLPEPQRLAISMAYFGGLTQKEIAERLQEPLGTIKTRTRAGLQNLRRLLVGVE
jgi:RNA polymerase sigma-70 factor (ECF subfamily)